METKFDDVNDLIKRRYEELNELNEKGFQPYAYSFDVDSDSEDIKDNYMQDEKRDVKIAGRIMAIRRMGKASFAHIMDHKEEYKCIFVKMRLVISMLLLS